MFFRSNIARGRNYKVPDHSGPASYAPALAGTLPEGPSLAEVRQWAKLLNKPTAGPGRPIGPPPVGPSLKEIGWRTKFY